MKRYIDIDKVKYVITKFDKNSQYSIESDDLDFFNGTTHFGLQCNTNDSEKVKAIKEKLFKIAELFSEIDNLNN